MMKNKRSIVWMDIFAVSSITSTSVAMICAGYALYYQSATVMGCVVISGLIGGFSRAAALVLSRLNEER